MGPYERMLHSETIARRRRLGMDFEYNKVREAERKAAPSPVVVASKPPPSVPPPDPVPPPPLLSCRLIQERTAAEFGLTRGELLSRSRRLGVVRPRMAAIGLCREILTKHSLHMIAESFGGWDHTTVIHAIKQTAARERTDEEFATHLNNIRVAIDEATKGCGDGCNDNGHAARFDDGGGRCFDPGAQGSPLPVATGQEGWHGPRHVLWATEGGWQPAILQESSDGGDDAGTAPLRKAS